METKQHGRVAFLSTPSVYFAVKSQQPDEKALDCFLFDVRELGYLLDAKYLSLILGSFHVLCGAV